MEKSTYSWGESGLVSSAIGIQGHLKAGEYENFNGQFLQDLVIFKCYINQYREDGIFLELGAKEGTKFSNTKIFEDKFGFSGILIEPIYDSYIQLIKNRPKSICYNKAITTNPSPFVEFLGTSFASGVLSTMPLTNRSKFFPNYKKEDTYMVPTARLDYLLNNNKVTYIDLFSLDVEGGELDVLLTMNWEIPVYVMIIEMDDHNKDKDFACRKILKEANMTFKGRVGLDEIWVNDNYFRRQLLFI